MLLSLPTCSLCNMGRATEMLRTKRQCVQSRRVRVESCSHSTKTRWQRKKQRLKYFSRQQRKIHQNKQDDQNSEWKREEMQDEWRNSCDGR